MTCEWEQYNNSTKEEMKAIYSKIAFDHATNPRNMGHIDNADGFATVTGPCGDTMQIWLKVNDGIIADAAFMTDGCSNAIASCSMVTQICKGKIVSEVKKLGQQDVLAALDGLPEEGKHCALLAVDALKAATGNYLKRHV